MGLFNFFTQEIAMDLGTANTLIIHNDEVVVNEPSIVALDRNNPKNILAVGKKALMMHEKTHESIRTVRPLKDGVIADFNAAELMIREMIKMIYPKKPLFPPSWRMMICIPSSITEVEKAAVRDSAEQAGAKEVYLFMNRWLPPWVLVSMWKSLLEICWRTPTGGCCASATRGGRFGVRPARRAAGVGRGEAAAFRVEVTAHTSAAMRSC